MLACMRMPARAVVVMAALALAAFVATAFEVGPLHRAYCLLDGRDGWVIELSGDLVTPENVRDVVDAQTSCASVHVRYVDWNEVEEGRLAEDLVPRIWVRPGEIIYVLVEGTEGQASDIDCPILNGGNRNSVECDRPLLIPG